MKKSEFKDGHREIMNELPISEMYRICKVIMEKDPTAIVTIRQTSGTDFPPYISIESEEFHDKTDMENVSINQFTYC